MYVKVEKKQGNILNVYRPKIVGAKNSKLLICSRDGRKIPPRLIPDTGDISVALGNRVHATFLYTFEGSNIKLGKEVFCQN